MHFSASNGHTLVPAPTTGEIQPVSYPVRVVLLQSAWQPRRRVAGLVGALQARGCQVQTQNVALAALVPACDLILLEACGLGRSAIVEIVKRIRRRSLAPLMVLTSGDPAQLESAALCTGADVVLAYRTHEEVILVRCRALLRRWLRTGVW